MKNKFIPFIVFTTIVMCAYRTAIYFTSYHYQTNLFERTFLTFILPNTITFLLTAIVMGFSFKKGQKIFLLPSEEPKKRTLIACGVLFFAALLYSFNLFFLSGEIHLPSVISVVFIVVSIFYLMTLATYFSDKISSRAMGIFSIAMCAMVTVGIIVTFVSKTEMNVVENYTYGLLMMCGIAICLLEFSKLFIDGSKEGNLQLYVGLTTYFAAMDLIPKGIYFIYALNIDPLYHFSVMLIPVFLFIFLMALRKIKVTPAEK